MGQMPSHQQKLGVALIRMHSSLVSIIFHSESDSRLVNKSI